MSSGKIKRQEQLLSTSGSGDSVLLGKDVAAHRAGYSSLHSLLTRALISERLRLEFIWFVLKKALHVVYVTC